MENPELIWNFKCYPLIDKERIWIERGGKLLLPVSTLREIDDADIPYPLMFRIINPSNDRCTHAGVVEFISEEGQVNVPLWMMNNLGVKLGDDVKIEIVSLPPAEYCKLEPLTKNLAFISDTKEVFEHHLKYFACLTEGDILYIYDKYKRQMYKIKVVETRPGSAVNIFDCKMELDLLIPERPKQRKLEDEFVNKEVNSKKISLVVPFKPFQGKGNILQAEQHKCIKKRRLPSKRLASKRKRNDKDESEPPEKKNCKERIQDVNVNELIFIRQKQNNLPEKQSSGEFEPFSGQGNSLKPN